MQFSLLVLGSSAALPTVNSNQAANIVRHNNKIFLIDCGEGTQKLLRLNKVKLQKLEHIFISHLHGDHFFGLIGLLSTMHLLGRKKEVTIYSVEGLKEIILLQLRASNSKLGFNIKFQTIEKGGQLLFADSTLEISSIPLKHRIACFGFLFKEKTKKRRLNGKALESFNIPNYARESIANGKDYISPEGDKVSNLKLTLDPEPIKSFAYCSDTAFSEKVIKFVKGVDMLYHEATFVEADKERAIKTFHSTAKQAAEVAKESEVKKLLLCHFSSRYKNKETHLLEAKAVFENSYIAEEGTEYVI